MEYIFVPKEFKAEKLFRSQRHVNVESPYHVNFEMEFVVVAEGTVVMQIQDEIIEVKAGEACYVMPFEPHSFETINQNKCHVLVFSSSLIHDFFEFLSNHKSDSRIINMPHDIISLLDRILPGTINLADNINALACLAPICYEIKRQRTFVENKNKYDDIFVEALSIANECYTSQISLDTVARRIGIDPATLSRKFSSNAKVSFNNYINMLRCHFAASQIQETDKTFAEIAYLSGFGSIRNFNRVFLRHMKCTPSQFKLDPIKYNNRIHL